MVLLSINPINTMNGDISSRKKKKEFLSAQVKLFSTTSTRAVFPLRLVPLFAIMKIPLK